VKVDECGRFCLEMGKRNVKRLTRGAAVEKTTPAHPGVCIDSTQKIECSRCRRWDLFDFTGLACTYEEAGDTDVQYVCRICELIRWLEVSLVRLREEIAELRKENDILLEKVVRFENELSSSYGLPRASSCITADTHVGDISVVSDSRKRERNVIVFNIPDPGLVSTDRSDGDLLNAVLRRLGLGLCSYRFTRIGKFVDSVFRPLLVTFADQDTRDFVVANSYLLKGFLLAGCDRPIFVSPDRTQAERFTLSGLVKELKHRRGQGERDLIIRDYKIICKRVRRDSVPCSQDVVSCLPVEMEVSAAEVVSTDGCQQELLVDRVGVPSSGTGAVSAAAAECASDGDSSTSSSCRRRRNVIEDSVVREVQGHPEMFIDIASEAVVSADEVYRSGKQLKSRYSWERWILWDIIDGRKATFDDALDALALFSDDVVRAKKHIQETCPVHVKR